jgi:hypothetical protein
VDEFARCFGAFSRLFFGLRINGFRKSQATLTHRACDLVLVLQQQTRRGPFFDTHNDIEK